MLNAGAIALSFLVTYNAPPISDARMFPSHAEVCKLLYLNRDYQGTLRRYDVRTPGLFAALDEAQVIEAQLQVLSWAVYENSSSYLTQRDALAEYRKVVTPALYYRHYVPPPVPTWRLPRAHLHP